MGRYREADRIFIEQVVIIPVSCGPSHFLVEPCASSIPVGEFQAWKDVFVKSLQDAERLLTDRQLIGD